MSDPTVTVLMAVWNGEAYLREAVDSILAQTYTDFELLVVDDCSTDSTPAILSDYAARDPRVRVLRNERNLTASPSLNRGLDEARGQYIARHDADDVSRPTRLAAEVAFFDAHPDHVLVGCHFDVIDAQGTWSKLIDVPSDDEAICAAFLYGNVLAHGSVMFRAGFSERYTPGILCSDDYDLWTRLVLRGKVAALPLALYRWRNHAECISNRKRQRQDAEAAEIRMRYRDALVAAGRHSVFLYGFLHPGPGHGRLPEDLRLVLAEGLKEPVTPTERIACRRALQGTRVTGREALALRSLLAHYAGGMAASAWAFRSVLCALGRRASVGRRS